MDKYDTALILTRVLTSGVVMSIEKSDRELPGLEKQLVKVAGRRKVVLLNSRTAGIHAALTGLGIGHGDTLAGPELVDADERFIAWLGVRRETAAPADSSASGSVPAGLGRIEVIDVDPDSAAELTVSPDVVASVLDLTPLGFGPAAAVVTDDELTWARAERLKIFGAHDLRTMWTQEEADASLVPGVQFNYRLSPLVAACIRMSLTRAVSTPGAA